MHLITGLGIGLFGFATTFSVNVSELVAPAAKNAASVSFVSISPSTAVELLEGAQRFYNEEWNDLVEVGGEWDELESAAGTILRPKGQDCSLTVYSRLLDELHYLPVPEEGEVAFENGWIRVDQVGAWQRGGSAVASMTYGPEAMAGSDCDVELDSSQVSQLVLGGDCWVPQDSTDGCGGVSACEAQGSTGCQADFLTNESTRVQTMHFESECGEPLIVSECTDDQGNGYYCVDEP